MKNERIIVIKMTEEEKRYAKAISLRSKWRCPRPIEGSVAHGLKCLLHERAEKEKINLQNSSTYFI
jgi:hypothetical protein